MRKIILLLTITFLVFSSCKKNNPLETDEAKEVKALFPKAINISFNIVLMLNEVLQTNSSTLFVCNNAITVTNFGTNDKIIKLDFGSGCVGTDGVTRKGVIIDTLTYYSSGNYMNKIYFENYYENDIKVMPWFGEGGNLGNMYSTSKFYTTAQFNNCNVYALGTNNGLQLKMLNLYLKPENSQGMEVQLSGNVSISNLGSNGFQDDVFIWSGNGFFNPSYKQNSDTWVEYDASRKTYFFENFLNCSISKACNSSKKVKGGNYKFKVTEGQGSVNPEITTGDFSFDSNTCN